ncbi:MAG: hypothetical protein HOO92_17370 [Methylococcaceae bacterium]|nr:hypothetical protein [Methylococcaceae bacterium]
MTDSKDNAEKSKSNHLHTMFDEKFNNVDPDIELEDQDAIDKLLVDTGFDDKQEADDFDGLDDFFKFDDFGDFEDSSVESVPTNLDAESVVEDPDENDGLVGNIDADELESDNLKAVEDFADIDDFSDFVDPVIEPIAVEEELVPIIDVPEELAIEDSIDHLLVETGFDDGIVQEQELLIDGLSVVESVDDLIPEKDELDIDAFSGQSSIDKLAASGDLDSFELAHVEAVSVDDEFSELDDFNDFVEPKQDAAEANPFSAMDEFGLDDDFVQSLADIDELVDAEDFDRESALKADVNAEFTEDLPAQVDEFGMDDEFAEPAPEVNVMADAEINESEDSVKPGLIDEFSEDAAIDVFSADDFTHLTEDDSVDILKTSESTETELDEDALVAAQLALMGKSSDEFLALDEIGDDLFTDSETHATPLTDEFSEQPGRNADGEDDFLLADFDITADTDFPGLAGSVGEHKDDFSESDFATPFAQITPDEPISISDSIEQFEPVLDENLPAAAVVGTEQSEAIAQLKSEQERLDKLYKKQLGETEAKAKKTATFGYIALAVGIVALSLAGGMGWVAVTAKSELEPLTESVKTIQADLNSQKPDQELSEIKATVEQLNQKIDGVVNQLHGPNAGTQESPQGAPLGTPIKSGELGTKEFGAKKDVVNKSLDIAPAHVPDGHVSSVSEHGAPAGVGAEKLHDVPVKPEAVKTPEPAKPSVEPLVDEKKTPTVRSETKAGNPEKSALKKKPAKTSHPIAQSKPSQRMDWSVNLIAFRQDWYAKSKASEYIQKGVPVEVVPVEISGVVWYRLRVSGFKNKPEADAYALRVKRALNLSSVWVGDI